jgi:hypothetical protein
MKTHFSLLLLSFSFLFSCKTRPDGAVLADQYCSSCHLRPEPALLDKDTWVKHVLPAMAPKVGVGVWQDNQYYVTGKGTLSIKQWQEIVDYYKQMAPDSLQGHYLPLKEDSLFEVVKPHSDSGWQALTTMVAIGEHQIFSSDERGRLLQWDTSLHVHDTQRLQSPGVDMAWIAPGTTLITCIGNMRAVDAPAGTMLAYKPATKEFTTLGLGLPRPVQSLAADFNKDGRMDYLVCGFGHDYGGLYILEQTPDSDYTKHTIQDLPGAIHAITGDFNNDGWPDIMALFAYADEGIRMFLNDHKGGFTSKNILRFPPVYGSTSFQLVDMNKDGLQDIVYTAGDNGDYSMIMKPYHGVYVYLNKGDYKYEQAFFYPINGCTKAIAADFDGDGTMDIATIAFFADRVHQPEEGFIYLKGVKDSYVAYSKQSLACAGRFLTMAAGDYDGDGDLDLLLGNYARGFNIQDQTQPCWDKFTPLILLKNHYSCNK